VVCPSPSWAIKAAPEPEAAEEGEAPEPEPEPAKSNVDERSLAQSAVNAGFVITLATELRTPISSLRVSFDLLKDPEAVRNNPEESKRLVGNIERSIARLERQASDLLEVGYINTGSLSLIKQPINISEPILAAIDISRSTAALRQVAIELEMEPDIPRVIADGFRLTQIMTHLLSNAIKFAPVGESVVISLSSGHAEESGPYEENSQKNANGEPDSLVVRVTDHGLGIRDAHFEHIFEPFYRITGEGIEGGAGVGLGLAIVKGLVELHSGKVWVHSTPRESTEFGFSIPLV
jgi:signal transduction histidine kinase